MADRAATSKCRLYEELCLSHCFVPIAIESTGVFGRDAERFFGVWPIIPELQLVIHKPTSNSANKSVLLSVSIIIVLLY